jgi:hypothetical protein
MSRINPYESIPKRTFESALLHLLETEYGLLGGRRILKLLVEDVLALVQEFYPDSARVPSGTIVWSCTGDEGQKAQPGKHTEEYKTVTVRLPLITREDLGERLKGHTPRAERGAEAQERDRKRLARLSKAAQEQGGLLTLAELSVLLNRSYQVVSRYARDWEEQHAEPLPLKGYRMDQGSRPTHKGEIVRLSEQGLAPPDIARETGHNLKSVERYLKDYERAKFLLKRGHSAEEIAGLTGRGQSVVLEYLAIAQQYHPELTPRDP